MQTRRSFFSTLALGLTGAIIAPSLLLSKSDDRFKWKRAASGVWVINPDYINAPYEIAFIYEAQTPTMMDVMIFRRDVELPPEFKPKRVPQIFPYRYDKEGRMVMPYIEK